MPAKETGLGVNWETGEHWWRGQTGGKLALKYGMPEMTMLWKIFNYRFLI